MRVQRAVTVLIPLIVAVALGLAFAAYIVTPIA
jgi:nitrogen fixation/metabolism regulation signal transduction histidine kinase